MQNEDVYRHIRHALAGELGGGLQMVDILREAADWLSSAHSWRFLQPRQVRLALRGQITVSDATYTHSTRTITSTGAFASYTHVAGDVADATAGTGVTLKEYEIASRTSDDAIVLKGDGLGSGADGSADVDLTLSLASIALPSDFMSAIEISATDSLLNGVSWVTQAELVRRRTSQVEVSSSWNYYGALAWAKDANDAAVPILDLWPTPVQSLEDAFTLVYRRRIVIGDEDTSEISVPIEAPAVETLLVRAARAIALGYEEGDEADGVPMDDRLMRLQMGPIWRAATRADGLSQPRMGPLRGGAVQHTAGRTRKLLGREVDAPT